MRSTVPSRKAQFKAALALSETTMTEFAVRHNVSLTHLKRVLVRPEESAPLTEAIDEFIRAAPKFPKPVAA